MTIRQRVKLLWECLKLVFGFESGIDRVFKRQQAEIRELRRLLMGAYYEVQTDSRLEVVWQTRVASCGALE